MQGKSAAKVAAETLKTEAIKKKQARSKQQTVTEQ